jgi:ABC-type transport system involved in cytochrome bd biosynthesis fused ATPase/permease subunit
VDDEESLEQLVGRYRPAGPPAALRDRVLESVSAGHRPTIFAAALPLAAAAVIAFFHVLASGAQAHLGAHLARVQRVHERLVEDLTMQFGDDPFARQQAEALVSADEQNVRE